MVKWRIPHHKAGEQMWMEQVPVEYRRTKEDSSFLRGALERDPWVEKTRPILNIWERNLFKSSAKNFAVKKLIRPAQSCANIIGLGFLHLYICKTFMFWFEISNQFFGHYPTTDRIWSNCLMLPQVTKNRSFKVKMWSHQIFIWFSLHTLIIL